MGHFFNPEKGIWPIFSVIADLVLLSLLWFLCSLPVLTLGPATAALYDCVVHCMRRKETTLFGRFFGTFRAELKTGVLTTLFWAPLFAVPLILFRLSLGLGGTPGAVFTAALLLVLFFLLAVWCWLFPTLSRFTFSVLGLSATALRLAFGHILRSVALTLLALLGLAGCYILIFPVFFLPCLIALCWSFVLEPVFEGYAEREEG